MLQHRRFWHFLGGVTEEDARCFTVYSLLGVHWCVYDSESVCRRGVHFSTCSVSTSTEPSRTLQLSRTACSIAVSNRSPKLLSWAFSLLSPNVFISPQILSRHEHCGGVQIPSGERLLLKAGVTVFPRKTQTSLVNAVSAPATCERVHPKVAGGYKNGNTQNPK